MKTINIPGSNSISTSLRRRFRSAGWALAAALALPLTGTARAEDQPAPIPLSEIGAKATADYRGDALSVTATSEGARLRCGFQKLEGRASAEGLWVESTEPGGGKLRLLATTVGREVLECGSPVPLSEDAGALQSGRGLPHSKTRSRWGPQLLVSGVLAPIGTVAVEEELVRFIRPGLTEEYSVSADGVRQDFVVTERPAGAGDLCVELALNGARAEVAGYGAKLWLEGAGRALAYSRLRAVDVTGKGLVARLEVLAADRLAVRVADANATYPVRIDPTFSDADWVSLNRGLPGADSVVRAIAVDVGSGNVYIGGDFTLVGSVSANRIAKWDGSAWSALGSGMSYPYAHVFALAVSGTSLYAGGYFDTAGGVMATNIAKWDGTAWSALGSGIGPGYTVYALAVSGTNLYAGGSFHTAGGVPASSIAKWDGTAWSALGSGLNGTVQALAVSGTNLYAGGDFWGAGLTWAFCIAKWDGSAWSALGSGIGPGYTVNALAVSGTNLYAGGDFSTAGGAPGNSIAKWNGSAWSALGPGVSGVVYALAASGTNLYAGGVFTNAGGVTANRIAKWNGSAWSALGSGIAGGHYPYDPYVYALAMSGGDLYAGGDFKTAGGAANTEHIAKWDGSDWLTLGSEMGGGSPYTSVFALAVSGTNLYAGGYFTTAGGVTATNIAKWDGSAWSALGSGMNDGVLALAVSGTDLYAGGYFSKAGGVANTKYIAKWNGSAWSALGSGMGSSVYALAVSTTDLYAGGLFTKAYGVANTRYIAKWNGSAWSALGSGMDFMVDSLAMSGTDLYAGGGFTNAGGVANTRHIAKWNGSVWSALGTGMDTRVLALAVSGTNLYAGGSFTNAGGVANTRYIAKWDGSEWSALGTGMNGYVDALTADGLGHLFVGGVFSLAGTNESRYIAQANIDVVPAGGRFGSLAYSPATGFSFIFSDATLSQPYRIQTSASLAGGSWSDFTNFTYTGPILLTDPSGAGAPKKFYRAVTP